MTDPCGLLILISVLGVASSFSLGLYLGKRARFEHLELERDILRSRLDAIYQEFGFPSAESHTHANQSSTT